MDGGQLTFLVTRSSSSQHDGEGPSLPQCRVGLRQWRVKVLLISESVRSVILTVDPLDDLLHKWKVVFVVWQ